MEIIHTLLGPNLTSAATVILMLVLIEGLLSIDNAAVLAAMVKDLPEDQRGRALKYGIIGAYVFRGICLLFVDIIMKYKFFLLIGGAYLVYMAISNLMQHEEVRLDDEGDVDKNNNWLYKVTIGAFGAFWSTVVMVEFMDLLFSLDNVVAAIGMVSGFPSPSKYVIVCIGVFIGILAMRFAAQWFIKLLTKYPKLNTSAFIVILIIGLKLILDFVISQNCGWGVLPSSFCEFMDVKENKEYIDLGLSLLNMVIFFIPLMVKKVEDKEI
jgi:YkoY family integral membrane protein